MDKVILCTICKVTVMAYIQDYVPDPEQEEYFKQIEDMPCEKCAKKVNRNMDGNLFYE